jgi:hypothetical protein
MDGFEDRLVFTDEATFHLCGKVNRHNLRFWGTEHPRATLQHERDSPKVNVFCAITNRSVFGSFFFAETTVTGCTYLDMLSEWLLPQLEEEVPDLILQQDCAHHIGMDTYPITSTTIFHNVGLAVLDRMMCH